MTDFYLKSDFEDYLIYTIFAYDIELYETTVIYKYPLKEDIYTRIQQYKTEAEATKGHKTTIDHLSNDGDWVKRLEQLKR